MARLKKGTIIMRKWIALIALALLIAPVVIAQDEEPAVAPTPEPTYFEPVTVETRAEDNLRLKADWFLVDANNATVILIHEMYTTRKSWRPLVGLLLGAGYNVLAIDTRGSGETRGAISWPKAAQDVQAWMNWLRDEAGVRDAISTIGSSMGSSLALIGCANDAGCRTAIAISPGWSYYGLSIKTALEEGLQERGALILMAERDRWPALALPRIEEVINEAFSVVNVPGQQHGMKFLSAEHQTLVPAILDWLASHSG